MIASFIIASLRNRTDKELDLEITSLEKTVIQQVALKPGDTIPINLPFGRAEDFEYPLGCLIANASDMPFKQIKLVYERTEGPLGAVFRERTEFIRKRFVHHWSLQVDGEVVGRYQELEGEVGSYELVIEPSGRVEEVRA